MDLSEWKEDPLPVSDDEKNSFLTIIDQPFKYLGEGNQVYAFVSQDDQYVIKFFKFGHLKTSFWDEWLPQSHQRENRRKRKLERIFRAHSLAFRIDREHAGLLFAHINLTDEQLPKILVTDRFNLQHTIPLDNVFFVVQKKGEPLNSLVKKSLSEGNVAHAKELLSHILNMYMAEYALGICDQDYNLWHNTGFAGKMPMRIDVGKIIYDPKFAQPEVYEKDLEKIKMRISRWLNRYYPQYKKELMTDLFKSN